LDQRDTKALDDAIVGLQSALSDVRETIPRCRSCEGLLTVAAQARTDLKGLDSPAVGAARRQFKAWLDEAEGHVSICNNCEVCVPGGPYQRFTAELARLRTAPGPT
jgi:hypothetical protein